MSLTVYPPWCKLIDRSRRSGLRRGARSVPGQRLAAAVIAVGRFAPAVRQHDPSSSLSVLLFYGVRVFSVPSTYIYLQSRLLSCRVFSALTTGYLQTAR